MTLTMSTTSDFILFILEMNLGSIAPRIFNLIIALENLVSLMLNYVCLIFM